MHQRKDAKAWRSQRNAFLRSYSDHEPRLSADGPLIRMSATPIWYVQQVRTDRDALVIS